jgi:hypothetical protein
MKANPILLIIAIGLGGIVGWELPVTGTRHAFRRVLVSRARAQPKGPALLERASLRLDELGAAIDGALTEPSPSWREAALLRIAQSVALADIPRALAMIAQRREPEVLTLRHRLLARWADDNPRAALAYAQSLPHSPERQKSLQVVLAEWTANDAASVLNWVNGLPAGQERNEAVRAVVEAMAEQDPREALNMLDSLGGVVNRAELQASILRRWAQSDPAAAAGMATDLVGLPAGVYADLAAQWGAKDPRAALTWVQALPSARDEELDSVAKGWAAVDVGAAMKWAESLPSGALHNRALLSVVDQWAQTDPQAAGSYALKMAPSLGQQKMLADIATQWAAQDPTGAMAWVKQLPVSNQTDVAKAMTSQLMNQDPKLAAQFAQSLNASIQEGAVQEVAKLWAQQDLSGAIAWIKQLPDGPEKTAVLQGAAQEWARNDPAAAADYVRTLPVNGDTVLDEITGVWGRADPESAVQWAEKLSGKPTWLYNRVLRSAISSWAQESPVDAANYVAGQPAGATQDAEARSVAAAWAKSDPPAAGQWVASFPDSPMRTALIGDVATSWVERDPVATVHWVVQSLNPQALGQHEGELEWLLGQWGDMAAVRSWVQSSPSLPDEIRNKLSTAFRISH